ncbi:MAG TPA: GNAT family N-acetyltransferase [Stellaceae bacterium]|jgi:ribosomal protein S18 acetylase RimI-like enzyme|nr:GNAT family N-acetyltransferase [Stellaceae bacterium]
MPITYRPARAQELAHAEELVAESINDLTVRHGFGRMASARPPHFQQFSLRDDPAGLWIAEDNGAIVGFAFSWVCGGLWFLAELFIAPDQQGRGVGNELLGRTLEHARKAGASEKALITFAFNKVSQGLYIRHGLFPRIPLYLFNAPREAWPVRADDRRLDGAAITIGDLPELAAIDAHALGLSREKHHRYLIAESDLKGFLFGDGSAKIGYAYISPQGHVGPLAVSRPEAMRPVFAAALERAREMGGAQVSALVPGIAEEALKTAMAQGARIAFPMMLMSSRAFGDWTCYLPRNPGFM